LVAILVTIADQMYLIFRKHLENSKIGLENSRASFSELQFWSKSIWFLQHRFIKIHSVPYLTIS